MWPFCSLFNVRTSHVHFAGRHRRECVLDQVARSLPAVRRGRSFVRWFVRRDLALAYSLIGFTLSVLGLQSNGEGGEKRQKITRPEPRGGRQLGRWV